MGKSFQFRGFVFYVFAILLSAGAFAQPVGSPNIASPRDSVSGVVAGSNIKIWYGSPSVKGRKIFGELESYGKVYRAGANEATQFTTSKDIKVEGKTLPAGTYAFFVIPTAGDWTIIFNKVAKQWGAFKYDQSQDQLRAVVKPKKVALHERLVYTINSKGFSMIWDTVEIPVSIK